MIAGHARIGCVVMAAGASRRMGLPKQLLRFRGRPLLLRAVQAAQHSAATLSAVVLGASRDRVARAIAGTGIETVDNADWRQGMSSSVRAAVAWARMRDCDGLLLAVGDQPHLTSEHLDALIAASAGATRIAASAYDDVLGVPALFPWEMFQRLESLSGDAGARALLQHLAFRVVSVPWPEGAADIDRPSDLAGAEAFIAARE
ncbi:MAG TPA: nucleotidyltransferase family protein [Polyangia bacterium]|nr:nucleotidyltransferase family protein [Polyangia bacterium]